MKNGFLILGLALQLVLVFTQDNQSNGDYDVMITIESFKNIIDDCVKLVYKNEQIISILEDQNNIISSIGVLGLRNKGKTYIMNLLTKKTLPSGFEINTEGISIFTKQEETNKFQLYLDSKGLSQPSQIDWENLNASNNPQEMQKGIKDSLLEINMIEKIQHDIIYDLSQILIIMVDNLELGDQKLIEQVILRNSENNQNAKKIFVVHNMKYIKTKIELDKQIERIKKQFCLKYSRHYVYFDNRISLRNKLEKVQHLFFAQENSEAGNIVNTLTIMRIKSEIERIMFELHFHEQIIISLSNAVKQYTRITLDEIVQYPREPIYSLQNIDCTDIVKNTIIKNSIQVSDETKCRSFHLKSNYTIDQQNSLIQDEIGVFKTEINYEIVRVFETQYLVIVDLPGKKNYKFHIEHQTNTLIITNKRNTVYQNEVCQQEDIQRCKGQQTIDFKVIYHNFSTQEIQYSIELPQVSNKDVFFYVIDEEKIREYDGQVEFSMMVVNKNYQK